ncbi:MAG TPA: ribulose-phosphate 3-epimerase [Actinomycetota bacterium]|nr:ribulose-phosphate 3-epimerase [Actinomycetota bacterium]
MTTTTTRARLAPSILTADFGRLADEVASVAPFVDQFHLDVMDGHYVDNLTFGPSTVAAVRAACDLPLHVHLMITDPMRYAAAFVDAGAARVSFHPEVAPEPAAVVEHVRSLGAGAGVAVHPDRGLDDVGALAADLEVVIVMTVRPGFGGQAFIDACVPKIASAKRLIQSAGASADIEVDGGVKLSNVDRVVAAGADVVVAGSAIFDGVDAAGAARRLRDKLVTATNGET